VPDLHAMGKGRGGGFFFQWEGGGGGGAKLGESMIAEI